MCIGLNSLYLHLSLRVLYIAKFVSNWQYIPGHTVYTILFIYVQYNNSQFLYSLVEEELSLRLVCSASLSLIALSASVSGSIESRAGGL